MAFLTETPVAIDGMAPTSDIPSTEILANPLGPGGEAMPACVSWVLSGVSLTLDPPDTPGSITWNEDYFADVPSLSAEADLPQLEVDPGVAFFGRAAAYFDARRGNFSAALLNDVAAYVRLDVPSDALTLSITQTSDQTQTTIALQNGIVTGAVTPPWMVLSNTGTNSDENVDFLLHYDVTKWTPDRIIRPDTSRLSRAPQEDIERLNVAAQILTVTLGCSNSNYP
jgi:hypothetical protein